ncbi:MAG: hypothetical protein ACRDTH_19780 [Pseudonocardiaceae bacterium]
MNSFTKGQLAEAIAIVRNYLGLARAMAELGLEPPVPSDLESLGREIMAVVHPTPQDTGGSHAVTTQQPTDRGEDQPRDGFSDQGSVEKMVAPALERPHREEGIVWADPPPPRRTLRDAMITLIKPNEVVSVSEVARRLQADGFSGNQNTVSNELSRWAKLGVLEKPQRGQYRRARASTDGAPAATPESPSAQQGLTVTDNERTAHGVSPVEGADV